MAQSFRQFVSYANRPAGVRISQMIAYSRWYRPRLISWTGLRNWSHMMVMTVDSLEMASALVLGIIRSSLVSFLGRIERLLALKCLGLIFVMST